MAQIALFHSVLGVGPGIVAAVERLEAADHQVLVVDQYEGRVFDDYEPAGDFAESIGFPSLMQGALSAVETLEDGFVVAGFSNGAGMAQYVATQRQVAGAVLMSGALPLSVLGAESWPEGVPTQIHYATQDPFRDQDWLDAAINDIGRYAPVEFFEYPASGHLFADPSRPDEYAPEAAALLWERVLRLCGS